MATLPQLRRRINNFLVERLIEKLGQGPDDITLDANNIAELNATDWSKIIAAGDTLADIIQKVAAKFASLRPKPTAKGSAWTWEGAVTTAVQADDVLSQNMTRACFLSEAVLAQLDPYIAKLLRVYGYDLSAAANHPNRIVAFNTWLKEHYRNLTTANLQQEVGRLATGDVAISVARLPLVDSEKPVDELGIQEVRPLALNLTDLTEQDLIRIKTDAVLAQIDNAAVRSFLRVHQYDLSTVPVGNISAFNSRFSNSESYLIDQSLGPNKVDTTLIAAIKALNNGVMPGGINPLLSISNVKFAPQVNLVIHLDEKPVDDNIVNKNSNYPRYSFLSHAATEAILTQIQNAQIRETLRSLGVDLSDAVGMRKRIENFNQYFNDLSHHPVAVDALLVEVNKLLKRSDNDLHNSLGSYDDAREISDLPVATIYLSEPQQHKIKTESVLTQLDEPVRNFLKTNHIDLFTADTNSVVAFNNWFRDVAKHPLQLAVLHDQFYKLTNLAINQNIRRLDGTEINNLTVPQDFAVTALGELRLKELAIYENLMAWINAHPQRAEIVNHVGDWDQNAWQTNKNTLLQALVGADLVTNPNILLAILGGAANHLLPVAPIAGRNADQIDLVRAQAIVGEARYYRLLNSDYAVAQPQLFARFTKKAFAELLKQGFGSDGPFELERINDFNAALARSNNIVEARQNLAQEIFGDASRLNKDAVAIGLNTADDYSVLVNEAKGVVAYNDFIARADVQAQPILLQKLRLPIIAELLRQHWGTNPPPDFAIINQLLVSANNVTEVRRSLSQALLGDRDALEVHANHLQLINEGEQNALVNEAKALAQLELIRREYPRLAAWLDAHPQRRNEAVANLQALTEDQIKSLLSELAKALARTDAGAPTPSKVRDALVAEYTVDGQNYRLLNNAANNNEELNDLDAVGMQQQFNGAVCLMRLERDYPVLAAWITQNPQRKADAVTNLQNWQLMQVNAFFGDIRNRINDAENAAEVRTILTKKRANMQLLTGPLVDANAVTNTNGLPNDLITNIKNEAKGAFYLSKIRLNYLALHEWINVEPTRRAAVIANLQGLSQPELTALIDALTEALIKAQTPAEVRAALTAPYTGHRLLTTRLAAAAGNGIAAAIVLTDGDANNMRGELRHAKLAQEVNELHQNQPVPILLAMLQANVDTIHRHLGTQSATVILSIFIKSAVNAADFNAASQVFNSQLGFDPQLDAARWQQLKNELQPAIGHALIQVILNAIPAEYVTLRAWMNNPQDSRNIAPLLVAGPPAHAVPLDAEAIATRLKDAKDEPALAAALRELLGIAADAALPAFVNRLNQPHAIADARFYEMVQHAEIQSAAAVKRPTLLAGLNANMALLKARLAIAPGAANYVDLNAQLPILFTSTSSFAQVSLALATLGIVAEGQPNAAEPPNDLAELARSVVAENVILATAKLPEANRPDIRSFLNHAVVKKDIQTNIAQLAQAQPNDDMQAWLSQKLIALCDVNKTVAQIEKLVRELVGNPVPNALTAEQENFVKQFFNTNHPVKSLDDRLGFIFMRWVRSNPDLLASMEVATKHWSETDWQRRMPYIMQPLLHGKRVVDGNGQYKIVDGREEAITNDVSVREFLSTLSNQASVLHIFHRAVLPAELTISMKHKLIGEARLNAWLGEKVPRFAAFLKNLQLEAAPPLAAHSAWEEIAEKLGAIKNVGVAKNQFEQFLNQYLAVTVDAVVNGRQAADFWSALNSPFVANAPLIDARRAMPAGLTTEQLRQLQAELVLAKFEESNPAWVRWFRARPAFWAALINSLKDQTSEKINNLLAGLSYILGLMDIRNANTLENIRAVFALPLRQVVEKLFSGHPKLSNVFRMFGVQGLDEISELSLLPDLLWNDLKNALSAKDLGFIINSSRTASALHALNHPAVDIDTGKPILEDIKNAANELRLARHPRNFIAPENPWGRSHSWREILMYQEQHDRKLIAEVLSAARAVNIDAKTDAAAHAMIMNAFTSLDAARRYFEKRLQELQTELATGENIVNQLHALPANVQNSEDIIKLLQQEKTLQTQLKYYINWYTRHLSNIDLAADKYARHIQVSSKKFAQTYGKAMLYAGAKHLTGVIPDTANFDIDDPAFRAQLRSNNDVVNGISIGAQQHSVKELKSGERYVCVVPNMGGPDTTEFGYSITRSSEGFKLRSHKWPEKQSLLGWFKQSKTDAAALDLVADQLTALANTSYTTTGVGMISLDKLGPKMLAKLLPIIYTKIEIQVYNGGQRIPVIYTADVDEPAIMKAAKKEADKLIKQNAPGTLQVNIKKVDEMTELAKDENEKVGEVISKRVGGPRG